MYDILVTIGEGGLALAFVLCCILAISGCTYTPTRSDSIFSSPILLNDIRK